MMRVQAHPVAEPSRRVRRFGPGRIHLFALACAMVLGGGARAQEAQTQGAPASPQSFEAQTKTVADSIGLIEEKIAAVQAFRDSVAEEGNTQQLACIDELLGRLHAADKAAHIIQDGWALAKIRPAFAQRSLDRLQVLRIYATGTADSALRCSPTGKDRETVVHWSGGTTAEAPTVDVVRPPVLQRPPLASPY